MESSFGEREDVAELLAKVAELCDLVSSVTPDRREAFSAEDFLDDKKEDD